MVKTRQKTIRIFEIDNSDDLACSEFLNKNALLLKNYLIFFMSTPSDFIINVCLNLGLDYFIPNNPLLTQKPILSLEQNKETKTPLNIISRAVRSGEEIESGGDLIICESVHNGARIYAEGNLMIFGHCEGNVECRGEYLILKSITSNQVIFSGQIFSNVMLERINQNPNYLKLIVRNGEFITIKEIE